MPGESKIFVPYRALGFVSNHVPLSLRYINRRNENLVVTCVGEAFHTYCCSKLNLLSVSGQHPDDITCITSDSFLVFSACKNIIYAWRRGTELKHTYKRPGKNVCLMLPFGPHLIAVYEDNTLVMWDIKFEEIFLEMSFTDFSISALFHPSTYINKILLGSHGGSLQLWNVNTTKLIYTFSGWRSSVIVLEQAPACDVVAVGLENGEIYVHNLKYDKTLMKFSQDWGAVTGISFRTDGQSLMASASTMGHIAVWDLDKRRLHSEIRDAHNGAISGLEFLHNEPLLITNSSDNSIKMWIFDLPDDGGRLLRLREGHSGHPLKIKFYGPYDENILSAGSDSTLRSFSTEADNMNKNLGQASYNRKAAKKKGIKNDPGKMFPIIDFAAETTREKDWDNIAAVHRHTRVVSTWSYERCCMGQQKLIHDRFKGMKDIEASCVAISFCGNFVVIGYDTGHLDKFNIQSGVCRGSFGEDTAHDGSVRGIVLDTYNNFAVSGGADKTLKFWKFKDLAFVSCLKLDSPISKMIIHRESDLIAVALDNFSIMVVDLESRSIVRRLEDHEGSITDMAFCVEARWLIVATMDSAIKVWDLKSKKLIDWFLVSPICVSLSVSPTFMATTHVGSVGIYLWANRTLYSDVSLHPLSDKHDPLEMKLPVITLGGKESDDDEEEESCVMNDEESEVPEFKSPEQIDGLITLSSAPSSHWVNLLDLDTIKRRNKPKEPVKVPKHAPFFLPIVSGLNPTFSVEEKPEDWKKHSDNSNILQAVPHASEFFQVLDKYGKTSDKYERVIEELKSYAPSKIDVEIRFLSPENGGSVYLMECFLTAMLSTLKTQRYFELVNTYLSLFFQIHIEYVASESSLMSLLEEIRSLKAWERLEEKLNYCLCFANYIRSAAV